MSDTIRFYRSILASPRISAGICRVERREPPLHNANREAQAYRCSGASRDEQAGFEKLRKNHAGHAFLVAGDGRCLSALKLSGQKSLT